MLSLAKTYSRLDDPCLWCQGAPPPPPLQPQLLALTPPTLRKTPPHPFLLHPKLPTTSIDHPTTLPPPRHPRSPAPPTATMSKPNMWTQPIRYFRWASHEKPAIFWSILIGSLGPVTLAVVPPIRRYMGDGPREPIPLTYPSMWSASTSMNG